MERYSYEKVERIEFDDKCTVPEYHAVTSIQICELANDGFFDLTRPDWDFNPKFTPEQHAQLCRKITQHYWYREIALVPPGIWKTEFLRFMNEIMPKYIPWYKLIADGMNVGVTSEYYKSRNVFSDFPQTRLAGETQDYASTGNDTEYERLNTADPLDIAERIRSYDDVDASIIKEIEPLFSCLLTVSINGW